MNTITRRAAKRTAGLICGLFALLSASPGQAQPIHTVDLASTPTNNSGLQRVYGSVGTGVSGVPVAGGHDVDGDGHRDYAFAAMRADPLGRSEAGQVFLVFGNGSIDGTIDSAVPNPRVLTIIGDQVQENAGTELWMADVTGDGLGDLLICRQNFSPDNNRIGAGALTILVGHADLRTMAGDGQTLDLRTPPENLPIVNILGDNGGLQDNMGVLQNAGERLCVWARTGDITDDGIADFVVGADRRASHNNPTQEDSGAAYVFRGGGHFQSAQTIDLADFGTVALGNVARIRPPGDCDDDDGDGINCHFGATVQIADLDDNGVGEVIAAAALNRAGAGLPPAGGNGNGSGGSRLGTVYIAWDDNFVGSWMPSPDFYIGTGNGSSPGSHSIVHGGAGNDVFGEELLGGLDYDNDDNADLFVGDLTGEGFGGLPNTSNAGLAHIIYNAEILKNQIFHIDSVSPPAGFSMATFQGPRSGAIAADTAMHGDYNADGIDDIAFSSPHDAHFGRINAGTIHILLGKNGKWPEESNLAPTNYPSPEDVQFLEIYGANGVSGDAGDTLCYSAADGDINGDGVIDIITNEMLGNGVAPGSEDAGNMILLDVQKLFGFDPSFFRDGFETE